VSVTVNPLATGISVSPSSLAFAATIVDATSAAKAATLSNGGSVTLDISSITVSANFGEKSTTCGATLAPGKSCQIEVVFSPTAAGALTGTLSISDNGSNSPQTVSLSGTGKVQAALTPATATFPSTTVGATSAAKVFTLHNYQTTILKDIAISTTGNFTVSTTTCQSELTSSATCTISVVFTPTAVGVTTGTLSVSDSAVNSPQTSNLSGTGKAPKK
jgi:hypothetical protein